MFRKQFLEMLRMMTSILLKIRLVDFENGYHNILILDTEIHTIALMILLRYVDRHPVLKAEDHECL
jgi:hypothetical protein